MRIGVSSAVFYPQESETSIERLLKLGFNTFEFFFNCEYEMSGTFIEKLKSRLDKENAQVVSVHPYTAFAEGVFFFSEYKRRMEESLTKYSEYLCAAKELGAKYFTFHGDRAFKGLDDDVCMLSDEACEVLNRLFDIAQGYGITLCLENVSWCKSANLKYLSEVKRRVSNIGFTLDLKQARRAGVPFDAYIDVMGDKIKNIHISDFKADRDCLLPGEGQFDFKKFFKRIKEFGYTGNVIIEVYSSNFDDESQIIRSKQFLEQIVG